MPKKKKDSPEFKFQMYGNLQKNIPNIYADFRKAAEKLKIPEDWKMTAGLTGAVSGIPALLREDVREHMEKYAVKVTALHVLVDEIRELVKSVYGDEYDACPVSTCEAGLWVSFDCLATPPFSGRGDNYRTRYIAPMERHLHHQGSYGRPFPPKYKDIFADRGSTAGELGFVGKRQNNMDTVFVPLVGAKYDVHGIKYHPTALLKNVNAEKSLKEIEANAERHAELLSAFASLAYTTQGYGYGEKDKNGAPKLQTGIAKLAKKYNIPYITDNAWGVPFLGNDIRKNGADVMVFSMDKASGSPTSGLIIGKEEPLVSIRRALGMHGARWGTGASYGKAAYVTVDPGKEALAGQIAALRVLRDKPKVLSKPVDDLYKICVEEFGKIDSRIRPYFKIAKDYNSTAVEINYEDAWNGKGLGIPIFTIEDMYSGSNIFQSGMMQIGYFPTIAYDANIFLSPGLGTCNEKGELIVDKMQKGVKGLVMLIEIVCKYAGIL